MPNCRQFVPQRVDLLLRDRIGDRQPAIGRRHVVVGRGHGQLGPADFAAGQPQALERLGAGHFVHQVQVDVQDRLLAGLGVHDVGVPDLVEHRPRRCWMQSSELRHSVAVGTEDGAVEQRSGSNRLEPDERLVRC